MFGGAGRNRTDDLYNAIVASHCYDDYIGYLCSAENLTFKNGLFP